MDRYFFRSLFITLLGYFIIFCALVVFVFIIGAAAFLFIAAAVASMLFYFYRRIRFGRRGNKNLQ